MSTRRLTSALRGSLVTPFQAFVRMEAAGGLLLAMTVPARRRIDLAGFTRRADEVLAFLREEGEDHATEDRHRPSEEAMDAVHGLEVACSGLDTPLPAWSTASTRGRPTSSCRCSP